MGDQVIKSGMITKRSQQKKSFGPVNYKDRLFVLTSTKLSYYEGNESQKGKIKDSFSVSSISFVGPISDKALHRTSAFQIIHDGYILYCCARSEIDRDSWITAIKQACQSCGKNSLQMQTRYHPSIFSNGKWQCCGVPNKNDQGCCPTDNAEDTKYTKPLPDLPSDNANNLSNFAPSWHNSHGSYAGGSQQSYPNTHSMSGSSQLPLLPPKPNFHSGSSSRNSNIAAAVNQLQIHHQQHSQSSHWNTANNIEPSMQNSSHNTLQRTQLSGMPAVPSLSKSHASNGDTFPFGSNTPPQKFNNQAEEIAFRLSKTPVDDEPAVPSYPCYFKGNKHNANQVISKSYEFTSPKPQEPPVEQSRINKIVVAIYDFEPMNQDDIPLQANSTYTVIDDSRAHWWIVRDEHGAQGFVPSNYVQDQESDGLETMNWFQKDMSRQRAEYLLKQDAKEGSFVIRNSTQPSVVYTLSVISKGGYVTGNFYVKHYHIKQNSQGQFYLSEKHPMSSVLELINYHKLNAGGLITRLRQAPASLQTVDQSSNHINSKWEIDINDLEMRQELGSGQFGCVKLACYRKRTFVAVKIMKENTMEEENFIEEAKVMTQLSHNNLVALYGVVTKQRPICIVTEFMEEGCLLDFMKKNAYLQTHPDTLLDICHQVCSAMKYLESMKLIHRDLAARNCLVGKNMIVKVADFGLTRYVLDDEYTSSTGSKFPIKWAAPEVLNFTKFSSKSDVWAFGVLMWELFTGGKTPFAALTNAEVAEQVAYGLKLSCPTSCPHEVYQLMLSTWDMEPEQRPAFYELYNMFYNLIDVVASRCLADGMYDA